MTTPASRTGRYHHGDLPNTVKHAALRILAEDGPAALSLRQVAAQAGVSHTAPRHHFGDKQHLLTELAIDGFSGLADAMADALAGVDQPSERLPALLAAYVGHHRQHPGHAAIMWRTDLLDTTDPRLQHSSLQTFRLLHDAAATSDTPLAAELGAYRLALMLWSLAHGAATLADRLTPALAEAIGSPDPELPAAEQLVTDFAEAVLR